ncbi:hypothetical protein [Roseateles sp.]|uniref:hypothetical protein n=1 Tax=Roseateles sp. TaxID=1971397 RepID=UPI003BAB1C9E
MQRRPLLAFAAGPVAAPLAFQGITLNARRPISPRRNARRHYRTDRQGAPAARSGVGGPVQTAMQIIHLCVSIARCELLDTPMHPGKIRGLSVSGLP